MGNSLITLFAGAILLSPVIVYASPVQDYDALALKVDKAVSLSLYKKNRPLDDGAADSLRVTSFATHILKSDLSKIDPHLLSACSVELIYTDEEYTNTIDSRVRVNPSVIFSYARHLYLDDRFPIKTGLSHKKVRKIEKKRRKRRSELTTDNSYVPHRETRDGVELLSEVTHDLAAQCMSELRRATTAHQPTIANYVTKTLNTTIEASTE